MIRMFSQFIYNSYCKRFRIALSPILSVRETAGLLYDLLFSLYKVEKSAMGFM